MGIREFLKRLETEKKLIRIRKEVDPRYDLANVLNSLGERPTIFEHVKGSEFPVFGGVSSSRDLIAEGLGITKEKMLLALVDAIRHPVPPEVVDHAPCQEVVVKDPDLSALPILTHLPGDGGPYISAGCAIIKDPDTGRNMAFHRMMFHGKNRFTVRLIPGRQTRTTYDKLKGEMEMAVCIGNSIPVMVAASLGPPPGVDEVSIANALGKTPVVRCVTKDLEVPAESEIVLEGRLLKETDREGPFLDLTETRDFERREPVFIVDAMTHRKDAMYQCLLPGRMEHKILMGMPKEPTIYDEVSKVCTCRNVLITLGGGSWLHGIVQIRKERPEDGKNAIEAAFKGHNSMKHVVIIDEDVDIYDMTAVEWAIATRFQGDRGLVIKEKQPGSSLDPSADHSGKKALTTKVGIDATMPAGVDPKKYEKVRYTDVNLDDYLR